MKKENKVLTFFLQVPAVGSCNSSRQFYFGFFVFNFCSITRVNVFHVSTSEEL
jgi:hypothetical protein